MRTLTLDFETFYDADYTLHGAKGLTNEEYIRDPRFETIMVGLKMDDRETVWVPEPQIKSLFAALPWDELAMLSHHSHFDVAILNWIYGYIPRFIYDTLPMFRTLYPAESASLDNMTQVLGLPPKGHEVENAKGKHFSDFTPAQLHLYGAYCINDVERTREAFDIMKGEFPLDELRLIDLTTRLATEPVLFLDEALLLEAQADELERKRKLLEKVGVDAKALGSNPVLAELLMAQGVDPPKKISPAWRKKNPKGNAGEEPVGLIEKGNKIWAYAFSQSDEVFKGMLGSDNETLRFLVEARFGVKSAITETRLGRLLGISKRGTLPVSLSYYAAHTGRFGGTQKLNLQNLTRSCTNEGCDGGKIDDNA
jgi:hypothetical protein